jgi:tight adherence protein B
VIALALAMAAGLGTYLLWTALTGTHRGLRFGTRASYESPRVTVEQWLAQAGVEEGGAAEFWAVLASCAAGGALVGWLIFGGLLPGLALAVFGASFPPVTLRQRRQQRRAVAQEAWPRMIEEIRILTSSVGRSIPQALFETGRRAPEELRPAFEAAHREWQLSTNFDRALVVLKGELADPTADAACETLLVAHELGGADLSPRLDALAEDRLQDTQGRKDARAKQGGVRFARVFVLLVPLGMAVSGIAIGNGKAAYTTPTGQLLVVAGLAVVVACWAWSGYLMRLPEEQRVFHGEGRP